jgi:hypothetical protein
MLSASGIDRLLRERKRPTALMALAATLAAGLAAAALAILVSASQSPTEGSWAEFVKHTLASSNISWTPLDFPYTKMAHVAARSLLLSAACCLSLAVLLWFCRTQQRSWAAFAIVLLGIAEVFLLARGQRPEVDIASSLDRSLIAFLETWNKDDRVLDLALNNNRTMNMGLDAIWGYNPVVLERYGEFIGFSQGDDLSPRADRLPYGGGVNPPFHEINKMLQILRCRYVLPPVNVPLPVMHAKVSMPHFLLVETTECFRTRTKY